MVKATFYFCDLDSKPTLFFPSLEIAVKAMETLGTDGVAAVHGLTLFNQPCVLFVNVKRLIFAEVEETRIGGQVVGPNQTEMPRATEVTNR